MILRTFASTLLVAASLCAAAAPAAAQDVGTYLYDDLELDDLTATGASSFADFQGRAVLIEFFAYW